MTASVRQETTRRPSIKHGAGAALALITALLRAGQIEMLAQQRRARSSKAEVARGARRHLCARLPGVLTPGPVRIARASPVVSPACLTHGRTMALPLNGGRKGWFPGSFKKNAEPRLFPVKRTSA